MTHQGPTQHIPPNVVEFAATIFAHCTSYSFRYDVSYIYVGYERMCYVHVCDETMLRDYFPHVFQAISVTYQGCICSKAPLPLQE